MQAVKVRHLKRKTLLKSSKVKRPSLFLKYIMSFTCGASSGVRLQREVAARACMSVHSSPICGSIRLRGSKREHAEENLELAQSHSLGAGAAIT
jgi:hypothetical protein